MFLHYCYMINCPIKYQSNYKLLLAARCLLLGYYVINIFSVSWFEISESIFFEIITPKQSIMKALLIPFLSLLPVIIKFCEFVSSDLNFTLTIYYIQIHKIFMPCEVIIFLF